ncbi:MAG: ABC transporter ATP-binding protein [Candidatus Saccharicenans sp.]|uniref:ABC transporter ATP-binding protein n=1 Tax=Candidatus Saccharicenans sp. TaxID=2819258 RepID=UPI004049A12F
MLWEVIRVTWKKIFMTNIISVVIISAYLLYCLYLIFPARSPQDAVSSLGPIFSLLAILLSGGLIRDEFDSRQIDPFLSRFKISSLFWGKLMAVVLLVLLAYAVVGSAALVSLAVNEEWSSASQILRILGRSLVVTIYLGAAGFFLATQLKGVMNFAALLVLETLAVYFSEKFLKILAFISNEGLARFSLKGSVLLLAVPFLARMVPWQMILLSLASAVFIVLSFWVFRTMAFKPNLVLARPEKGNQILLRVSGLKMTFREGFSLKKGREALRGVDFAIKTGKLTGFLGPNGAGKTTTLRIILNLLKPRAGRVEYFAWKPESRRRKKPGIGYLQETAALYPFLTVREILSFVARNEGLSRSQAARLAVSLAEKLGLGEHLDRRLKTLSKGTVQKVALAVATIGQPEFLVFDEPYTGLDPIIMYEVRNLILELKARGTTIFLSSHLLPEVEKVCDELILINNGQIICTGEIEKIKAAWRLYQALKNKPDLADRINRLVGEEVRGKNLSYFAGLDFEPLLGDQAVASAIREVPLPDVEKIFLDSVMNS